MCLEWPGGRLIARRRGVEEEEAEESEEVRVRETLWLWLWLLLLALGPANMGLCIMCGWRVCAQHHTRNLGRCPLVGAIEVMDCAGPASQQLSGPMC